MFYYMFWDWYFSAPPYILSKTRKNINMDTFQIMMNIHWSQGKPYFDNFGYILDRGGYDRL